MKFKAHKIFHYSIWTTNSKSSLNWSLSNCPDQQKVLIRQTALLGQLFEQSVILQKDAQSVQKVQL